METCNFMEMTPARTMCVILVPGLMRDLSSGLYAMSRGVPCLVVPTERPHPLMSDVPEYAMLLREDSSDPLHKIRELLDVDSELGQSLLQWQETVLTRTSMTSHASAMIQKASDV